MFDLDSTFQNGPPRTSWVDSAILYPSDHTRSRTFHIRALVDLQSQLGSSHRQLSPSHLHHQIRELSELAYPGTLQERLRGQSRLKALL